MRFDRLIAVAVIAMLPFGFGCAQQPTQACRKVEINSAGSFCLDPTRVLGIATGSGGLGSVANYVRISPPVNSNVSFKDVSRIVLMADVNPAIEPRCEVAKDTSRSCAMSVAGKKLTVVVSFRSTAEGRFEERTKIVATDVAKNVVKK